MTEKWMPSSLGALVLAVACASKAPTPAPAPETSASPGPLDSPPQRAADNGAVVVARVVGEGPIGDGACVQKSYQLAIEARVEGEGPSESGQPWVHYESCRDHPAPPPGPGETAGDALRVGARYELHLRRGASKNFGAGFMIIKARAR